MHCQSLFQAVRKEGGTTYCTERKQQKQAGRMRVGARGLCLVNGWPLPRRQCLSESHVLEGKKVKNLEGHLRMGGPPPEPHLGTRGWKRGSWLKELTRSMGRTWGEQGGLWKTCLLRPGASGIWDVLGGSWGTGEALGYPFCDQWGEANIWYWTQIIAGQKPGEATNPACWSLAFFMKLSGIQVQESHTLPYLMVNLGAYFKGGHFSTRVALGTGLAKPV